MCVSSFLIGANLGSIPMFIRNDMWYVVPINILAVVYLYLNMPTPKELLKLD